MVSAIFLLAAKLISAVGGKGRTKYPSGSLKMTVNSPENICKSILNFTALFGEINPDMSYLCRRGQSGPEKSVFASFPSVRRESMKKTLNLRFFAKNM